MQISNNKLVTIEYKLYVKNNDGSLEIMEETSSEAPLKYIHGAGMMLPKFEEALDAGMSATASSFLSTATMPTANGAMITSSICRWMSSPPTAISTRNVSSRER